MNAFPETNPTVHPGRGSRQSRIKRIQIAANAEPIDPVYNKFAPIIARHLAAGNKLGEAENKETKEEVVSLYNQLKEILMQLAESFQEHLCETNSGEFAALK